MDWKNPPYAAIFAERMRNLERIRGMSPGQLEDLRAYYRDHISAFIHDWGVTYDPRNPERGLPALIPFIPFPRQEEWVEWVVAKWKAQRRGMTEKSRDGGISWLSIATACSLCIFNDGLAIGFGSRVVDLVDKIGTMKPLLPKARMFMKHLPEEFNAGWVEWRDAPYMRVNFPETGSTINGEGGDQIGRGDRASIYFVDEAAYLARADLVEHSLSATTNCRIDVSSVRNNTVFAKNRHEGKIDVFVFDWRQDPRKDEAWYERMKADYDEVTVAQEIDRDYSASVEGVIIPAAWVRAAVGAREKLGIAKHGKRKIALDVADEGQDVNAVAGMTDIEIDHLQEWSGKGSDIFATVSRTCDLCDEMGLAGFRYDADGLGAGVRGDGRIINDQRVARGQRALLMQPYRGSEAVLDPEGQVFGTIGGEGEKGRTNADYYKNRKAQAWGDARRRFQLTHRWVVEGRACEAGDIISIDPKLPANLLNKLTTELSQPTWKADGLGKMVVDKKPDGQKSPNLADCVVMRCARMQPQLNITPAVLAAVMRSGRRRP